MAVIATMSMEAARLAETHDHRAASTGACRSTANTVTGSIPECVKDESKVPHSGNSSETLLIHITCNLKGGTTDVEVCQRRPQPTNLHRKQTRHSGPGKHQLRKGAAR